MYGEPLRSKEKHGGGNKADGAQQRQRPVQHQPGPCPIPPGSALGDHPGDGRGHPGGGNDQQPGIKGEHGLIIDHALHMQDVIGPDADQYADDLTQDPRRPQNGRTQDKRRLFVFAHIYVVYHPAVPLATEDVPSNGDFLSFFTAHTAWLPPECVG